jgi:glycerophosphoryl diester phosphodiesterase
MECPENTLQAFIHSHKVGVDVIETDVRITKDGKIILCHDKDFSRLCQNNSKVIDTLSSELPIFNDELPMHFSHDRKYKR